MKAFTKITGLACPLDRANVDTDAIIPKQFLKSIKRTGFGPYLFDEWRYTNYGEPDMDCSTRPLNKDFVLNQVIQISSSKILLEPVLHIDIDPGYGEKTVPAMGSSSVY